MAPDAAALLAVAAAAATPFWDRGASASAAASAVAVRGRGPAAGSTYTSSLVRLIRPIFAATPAFAMDETEGCWYLENKQLRAIMMLS